MTTSTSRPASAASTASRCPRRNASKPNSSASAPAGSVARATGSGGAGPSPGRDIASGRAIGTGEATAATRRHGRAVAELSHLRVDYGERVLERVLALRRRLGVRQRIVAGEAGVAVLAALPLDRGVHAVERQVR